MDLLFMTTHHLFSLNDHQRKVLRCLEASDTPLSAYKILQLLRDTTINAPQQIYRALEKLCDLRLVHRIESLNAYVVCTNDCHDGNFNVMMLCARCQKTFEFSDQQVLQALRQRARDVQFESQHIVIEMSGLCWACQQKCSGHPAKEQEVSYD